MNQPLRNSTTCRGDRPVAPTKEHMKSRHHNYHRKSIRLKGYNYSSNGAYFITICTHNHRYLFGEIVDGTMILNTAGEIVQEEWERSTAIRREITLDAFIVMPNHIHGIVCIRNVVGATGRSPLRQPNGPGIKSLGSFVGGFKSIVTTRINELHRTPHLPVWQRNYYEHIIRAEARTEESLNQFRQYVIDNPLRWDTDELNPRRITPPYRYAETLVHCRF